MIRLTPGSPCSCSLDVDWSAAETENTPGPTGLLYVPLAETWAVEDARVVSARVSVVVGAPAVGTKSASVGAASAAAAGTPAMVTGRPARALSAGSISAPGMVDVTLPASENGAAGAGCTTPRCASVIFAPAW